MECTVEVHNSQNAKSPKEIIELENCIEMFDAVKTSSKDVKDLVIDARGVETEVKILNIRRNLQIESFENCFGPYIKPP